MEQQMLCWGDECYWIANVVGGGMDEAMGLQMLWGGRKTRPKGCKYREGQTLM